MPVEESGNMIIMVDALARTAGTTSLAQRLIRLPMWLGLSELQPQRVCDVLTAILRKTTRGPPV